MKKLLTTITLSVTMGLSACSQVASVQEANIPNIAKASLKAFYLIRSGVPIESKYAGEYARPLGHADTQVYIHPSAVSEGRPAESVISSPLGWYDAGDYNKYTVNSAYACGLMLLAYDQAPEYFKKHSVDIPESNNKTADVLDEVMFNLKWLFTMQDPADGGVYHKLTTPNFEGFVMPKDCHQKRYVVQKSVTGSLDFAAVMAQAARIYKNNADYPDFSKKAEEAAIQAFEWAEKNAKAFYVQNEMNKKFQPAVNTGEYGDGNATDERFWAATELYLLTGKKNYLEIAKQTAPKGMGVPSWGDVDELGALEWIAKGKGELHDTSMSQLDVLCQQLAKKAEKSPIKSTFGYTDADYGWGCLAGCCMEGYFLMMGKKYLDKSKTKNYLEMARNNFKFLTGDGPTGYCFITAFGKKPAMHPHHRISAADGIEKPFPGLLVGGPNGGQQDKNDGNLHYPSDKPALSYLDEEPSYASNEIAINWQASLVAFASLLDAQK